LSERRTYIDDTVDAIFQGKNHRRLVLQEAERRIFEEMGALFETALSSRYESEEWWKQRLIRENLDKRQVVWFGGMNFKTIGNTFGSTRLELCREVCLENVDAISDLLKDLPEDFPTPKVTFLWKGQSVKLTERESFLLIRSVAAMVRTVGAGIWSEVGKQAGDKFLRTLFMKLGIPEGPLSAFSSKGLHYELNIEEKGRAIDAVIYHEGKTVLGIEFKILGAGNPEIVDEAISRLGEGDVFLVDAITPLMTRKTEERGIRVVLLKDAYSELLKLLRDKGYKI